MTKFVFICCLQALLGQKYGYRPFPSTIDAQKFEMMRESLLRNGKDVTLLLTWFKKDTNVIPSVYTLQPISSIIENFNNKVFDVRGILVDRWRQLSLSRNSCLVVLDAMLIPAFWEFFLCDYLTWHCGFSLCKFLFCHLTHT